MRALLDVNVLIALLDTDHLHHGEARDWLSSNIDHSWASCPLTRMAASASCPNRHIPAPRRGDGDAMARILARFDQLCC
jgi:predicted nucleic acid-binding protein